MIELPQYMWLDDVRPAPNTWTWVKTVSEAITHMSNNDVMVASLDHDLGAVITGRKGDIYLAGDCRDGSGMDVVEWMIQAKRFPQRQIVIHSWNREGAQAMHDALKQHYHGELIIRPYLDLE